MIENGLIDSSQKIVNEINLMQSKIETTSEDDIFLLIMKRIFPVQRKTYTLIHNLIFFFAHSTY